MPGINGLSLAKELNAISNSIKIVFVTGYAEYALDAFDVYAFGYLLKPCRADSIKAIIDKMRIPLVGKKNIEIKTFGNFDVYYKGKPIVFNSKLSKELLAYLVDRQGTVVSRQEAAGILFGDDFSHAKQVSLSKIAQKLQDDLERAGINDLFVNNKGYYVNLADVECDLIEYLNGNPRYKFSNEYLEQYSWAEYSKFSIKR